MARSSSAFIFRVAAFEFRVEKGFKITGTTAQSRRTRNFTFSLAAVSAGSPPVERRLLK
jgi:hypothetical protein